MRPGLLPLLFPGPCSCTVFRQTDGLMTGIPFSVCSLRLAFQSVSRQRGSPVGSCSNRNGKLKISTDIVVGSIDRKCPPCILKVS